MTYPSQYQDTCWVFSIINESENEYFWQNLELLLSLDQQFVVVDGGSVDSTKVELTKREVHFHEVPESTRGQRFDVASAQTKASIIVFVHPRTKISTEVIQSMNLLAPDENNWGAFSHSFDSKHFILQFTSWWSNYIRGDLRGIYYLDHVLWVRRSLLIQAGGFPGAAIFEDTIFCERLLPFGPPTRLPQTTVTSAVRFKKNGFLRQIITNQLAKLRYYLRQNNSSINRKYESGFDLNGKSLPQGQQAPAKVTPSDRT